MKGFCTKGTIAWFVVSVLVLLILVLGCATIAPRPGTGDISFRLLWSSEADLDLHTIDPLSSHTGIVGAGNVPSVEEQEARRLRWLAEQRGEPMAPVGILDVDCNAGPQQMCRKPIENIYWPEGFAPTGEYQVWVVLFRKPPEGGATRFSIEVRHGERVVESFRGSVEETFESSEHFRVVF